MPTKPLSLVALVSLVPIALLAFFALRSFSLESSALNARREHSTRQRMEAAAALAATQLKGLAAAAMAQTQAAYAVGGTAALSSLARKRVFTYVLVVKNGVSLYSATAIEHQYDAVRMLQDNAGRLVLKLGPSQASVTKLLPAGKGFTLLRCSRDKAGPDICIAIDEALVTEALRAALGLVEHSTGFVHVGLVAPNGMTIAAQGAGDLSKASQPLEGLLTGWQLHGEDPISGGRNMNSTLVPYLIAGALIAGWLVMTWMLHRSAVLKEEASVARANVIAQLAHELRTPLANLKLHTDLLRRKSADSTAVERYGIVLDNEIDRLSSLAENAIAVARGAMAKPRVEAAVPDDSVRVILERFEPTLANARCGVCFTPGAPVKSRFDRTSWERGIINLVDNARKYAPGSDIEITTTQVSDVLRLDVCDHGPGIAADQREQIFEPLERGVTTAASGFGLGLAAVRALARQNGGDCWVEAMHPGARFILTMKAFPVEALDEEHPAPC